MKMFKKLFATLFLASVMSVGATACGITATVSTHDNSQDSSSSSSVADPVYELSLEADKTTAKPGEKVTLTATLTEDGEEIDADDVEFEFTAGAESAKLKKNVLTIASDAKANDVITVIAKIGATKSEPVSITVDVPLEKVEISANGVTNVNLGGSVVLTKTITPANADASEFKWEITEGENLATMAGDVLVVNSNAKTGDKITVQGSIGKKKDTLTFIVGYPLETLTVTVQGSANIPAGQTVNLKVEKFPENTTNGNYTWVELAGNEYFSIENDKLIIDANTPDNTELKFKAVSEGGKESAIITITVGVAIESLEISADLPEVLVKGESYTVTLTANPMAASTKNVEWVFNDEAKGYITGNFNAANNSYTFTVSEAIPSGTPLSFKAVSGTIESTEITGMQVGIALESINLTMNGSHNVDPGQSRVLNVSYNPNNATDKEITWLFTEGEGLCTIVNNVLTVNEGVEIGSKISFKASVGNVVSEETIEIIVGTPITSIVIGDSSETDEIVKGNSVDLYIVEVLPAGAKQDSISWKIVEGNDYVERQGNKLVVKADAPSYATIKVVAESGDAISNELVFTVMPTQEEINASQFYLTLSEDEIRVDKNAASTATLLAEVYDFNGSLITDKNIIFTITRGDTLLEISAENGVCNLTAIGHGDAQITATIEGTALSETADVIVIVPPTSIELPEVFTGKERGNYTYNFSLKDALPFVATPTGTKVCQDVTYLFAHEDGTTGAEVATYANGQITFKKTGKVTVTASSNSGSAIETTKAYSFNINEGKNVYTFEEMKTYLESWQYDGSTEVNIVALNKITGPKVVAEVNNGVATYKQEGTKDYGYSFVPAIALSSIENQNFMNLVHLKAAGVLIQFKGAHINGNNHTIDVSQLRPLTAKEIEEGYVAVNENFLDYTTASTFQFWPGAGSNRYLNLTMRDLKLVGNATDTFAGEIDANAKAIGVPNSAVIVGNIGSCPTEEYCMNVSNVTVEGFQHGMNLTKLVDSVIENYTATNCFIDGLALRASIVTLRNATFRNCGATGIEFTPENCNKAGVNENQNQKVTIEGHIDAVGMISDGNTRYFQNYTVNGFPVPAAINSIMDQLQAFGLNATQISNMRNSNNQFAIIALIFNGAIANSTEIAYPADMEGNMAVALDLTTFKSDLPADRIDTEHKYILMPLVTSATSTMGSVLLYNLNYQG